MDGVLVDELDALAAPAAELLEDAEGDWDRSITVAEGSSESEDSPNRAFLAGVEKRATSF